MMDFICLSCGHQMDGDVMHNKPEICPVCGCCEFRELPGEPVDDRKENEHDFDYLAGKG